MSDQPKKPVRSRAKKPQAAPEPPIEEPPSEEEEEEGRQLRRERWLIGLLIALLVIFLVCCILFMLLLRSLRSDVEDLARASATVVELANAQRRVDDLRAELRGEVVPQADPSPAAEVTMVAVGNEGTILTSSDGSSWTPQSIGSTKFIFDVEWNGSLWVAVGAESAGGSGACGEAYSSTDGVNWAVHDLACPEMLQGVGWNGQVWVAVGLQGVTFTSTNGVNWNQAVAAKQAVPDLWEVEWDDTSGEWYAVGDKGFVRGSSNGTSWTNIAKPAFTDLKGLMTTGSDWYVVGENGVFARSAVGSGVWGFGGAVVTSTLVNDIDFNGSQFLAVGSLTVPGPDSLVLVSANGNNWPIQQIATTETIRGVAWAGSQWIAVGDKGLIFTSTNGHQWVDHSLAGTTHDLWQVAAK